MENINEMSKVEEIQQLLQQEREVVGAGYSTDVYVE